VLACAFGSSTAALAEDVPLDESLFTEYVAQKMRQVLTGESIDIKSPLVLSIGSLNADLRRIYAFCKSNAPRCASEVDNYVKGAEQIVKERNAPLDKNAVRLVIRTSEYIKRAQASLGPDGPTLQSKPFVGDLVVVPVLDTPRAIRPLDNRDAAKLHLAPDELLELGRANLAVQLKPLSDVAHATGAGQIGTIRGNIFDTSRLLLTAEWRQFAEAQGGTLLVAAPTTDVLLYVSEATPTAVDALRTLARSTMTKAPNPLSMVVLKWTPTGWQVLP
jgi:uncharacterized protein YtpQ (UPF0354 family)